MRRQTACKWARLYREAGPDGLEDRSSRPYQSPRTLPEETVRAILAACHDLDYGPDRLAPLAGIPPLDHRRRPAPPRPVALRDRDRPTGILNRHLSALRSAARSKSPTIQETTSFRREVPAVAYDGPSARTTVAASSRRGSALTSRPTRSAPASSTMAPHAVAVVNPCTIAVAGAPCRP